MTVNSVSRCGPATLVTAAVGESYANVKIVADNIEDVNLLGDNIININNVGENIQDVNTVVGNLADIKVTSTNIEDISTIADSIRVINAGDRSVAHLKELPINDLVNDMQFSVAGFYTGTLVGGGIFVWDANRSKADHNGGTIIAPEALVAWDGSQVNLASLLNWSGSGTGCFVRLYTGLVDFEWFGATVDGSDSTLSCDKATLSIANGSFTFRAGLLNVDYIKFDSNQSLIGGGFGCKIVTNPNATLPTIHSRNPASTVRVTLRNFFLDGNKANQINAVDGINLDATGMSSPTLPRHHFSTIFITNTKGRGLVHPFPGRDSNYSDIVIYACDGIGCELRGSDSQFNNMNIGQSGLAGLKASGGSANLISNTKCWYSGRISPSIGYGYHLAKASGTQLSNCESQENQFDGLFIEGTTEPTSGIAVTGFVSNSDNTSGTTGSGVRLLNVVGATIDVKVWALPALAGAPSDALTIGGGTTGCNIKLMASDFTSYAIDGIKEDIDNNKIELNNREGLVFVESNISGFKIYSQFAAKTFDFTLDGNVTIKAPTSRAYAGMEQVFIIRQNAIGGHSISFDPEFKVSYTAATSPNAINIFKFISDRNSNWIQESFSALT
jgi:hypothetical protein